MTRHLVSGAAVVADVGIGNWTVQTIAYVAARPGIHVVTRDEAKANPGPPAAETAGQWGPPPGRQSE